MPDFAELTLCSGQTIDHSIVSLVFDNDLLTCEKIKFEFDIDFSFASLILDV